MGATEWDTGNIQTGEGNESDGHCTTPLTRPAETLGAGSSRLVPRQQFMSPSHTLPLETPPVRNTGCGPGDSPALWCARHHRPGLSTSPTSAEDDYCAQWRLRRFRNGGPSAQAAPGAAGDWLVSGGSFGSGAAFRQCHTGPRHCPCDAPVGGAAGDIIATEAAHGGLRHPMPMARQQGGVGDRRELAAGLAERHRGTGGYTDTLIAPMSHAPHIEMTKGLSPNKVPVGEGKR